MSHTRYIAAGFVSDSEKLLNDFVQENSTHFTVFATKWKEHNFGLIFSLREKEELIQFTHEIYQLTLEYLKDSSLILQVGAVYLLYALYRNQPSIPPVRIRMVLQQYEVIKKLRVIAEENCYMHLYYVINFLNENSLDFVAHPVLYGPCTSRGKMENEKPTLPTSYLLKECKSEMSAFKSSNLLKEVQDLSKEYAELQAEVLPSGDKEIVDDSPLQKYNKCLDNLLDDRPYSKKKSQNKPTDTNLGTRRACIKANQFERKALFRQLNPSDSEEDYEPSTPVKETQVKKNSRKRRIPKGERKIGRPKKPDLDKILDSDANESDCSLKLKNFTRKRGPTSKTSYLEDYELNLPSCSKMIKDLFSSDTSEEESSTANKAEAEPGALLNNSEDQVDKFFDQVDKTFDQVNKTFDQDNNSEDRMDDSEVQENNKDNSRSDASDKGSNVSNEDYDLCF